MKVLVTGATGFIGNYVVNELLNRNIDVITSSSDLSKAREKEWFEKTTYVEHDIHSNNIENLFDKFFKPDILIHLAWAGLNNFKNESHVIEELPKQKVFLENLISNGLKDVTVCGTCLEYGMAEGELHEDMPSVPTIAYPIAKNNLRLFLQNLKNEFSFSLKWMRIFYLHGAGQSPKSILSQLQKAIDSNETVFNMSLGEQVRDYLPVTEVSQNIIKLALQTKTDGIVNCCSNNPIKIIELVQSYLKTKNKNIQLNLGYYPYTDYEPMKFWGSNKKLNTISL